MIRIVSSSRHLERGFDHPMAKLLSRSAEKFIGPDAAGPALAVKHYPGRCLSDDASAVVFGELLRLHTPEHRFAVTFETTKAAAPTVASPQYLRQVLPRDARDGRSARQPTSTEPSGGD